MQNDLINRDFHSKENEDEQLINDLKSEICYNKNKILLSAAALVFIIAVAVGISNML